TNGQCLTVAGGVPTWGACGTIGGSGNPTEMAYWAGSTTLGSAPAVFVNGNATIEWRRGTYTTPTTLTDAATITSDWSGKNRFRVTITANRLLGTPTNAADGQQAVYEIVQDGIGGRALTFDSKFTFADQITACPISQTANKRSYVSVVYVSSTDRFNIVSCLTGY